MGHHLTVRLLLLVLEVRSMWNNPAPSDLQSRPDLGGQDFFPLVAMVGPRSHHAVLLDDSFQMEEGGTVL